MKKFMSLALILCLSFSLIAVPANAAENESTNNNAIYLFSENNATLEESNPTVTVKDIGKIESGDVLNAPYIIVDFDVLNDDAEVLDYISNLVKVGKIIFVRAEAHTANVSLIERLFDYSASDNGQIYETSSAALMERINTFGFVVYLDSNQNLQVVRQSADYVSLTEKAFSEDSSKANASDFVVEQVEISGSEMSKERASALLNSKRPSFDDEVEAINEFLSYNSPTDVHNFSDMNQEIDAQGFDVGCNYERLWDTVNYYTVENGMAVGSITRRICAARLYPETTVKIGAPSPVATGNTKWAFQSVINLSPKWSTNEVVNGNLYTSFTTYPVGSSNLTYKNVIMDYQPKTDTSGKTDVTYSIGPEFSWGKEGAEVGISGGVSWVKSYEDITFTVDYSAGANTSTNIAAWYYTIGRGTEINGDLWFPKALQKSTVELISAVRVDNNGHTSVGVQLNTQPTWGKLTGFLTGTAYTPAMSSVVYILPVR